MNAIDLVSSGDRSTWTPLVDPPGQIPSGGRERPIFTSSDGSFACGFWEHEPDTWSFERPHDEVAYILDGEAEVETHTGRRLQVGPGDVLVTPNGSKGTWHIRRTLRKFYAIYSGASVSDTDVRVIGRDDPVDWIVLDNAPGDTNPPGQEWYAWRNADGRFSTGVWQRAPETGAFELAYHEVACLIEGDVDIETSDGVTLHVGPGDVLVTPIGARGIWRANAHVKKFWVVHHE